MTETAAATPALRMSTARGRWVVAATVLGSGMAALDATVVGIALPAIGRDFHAGIASLQWVVNAYTLTLAGLLLLGGTLGDSYGRRKVFVIGVVWFALASLLCGVAPTAGVLIAARALQGVGGALLTPGSLAILQASFAEEDRMAAIGAWSGLGGVATAIGPFLGGWLIDAVSWRLIFSSTCRWPRSWSPSPPATYRRPRRRVRCRGSTTAARWPSAARWPGSPTG